MKKQQTYMIRKICVIISARPSYSRIKSVLDAMQENPDIDLKIVVTSSAVLERYGKVVDLIKSDGFDVYDEVYSVIEGGHICHPVKDVGNCLNELSSILYRLKPDAVVTIADRYETIANAISAAYMNIPLIHIQGGEFTGSIDNKVRHAVTKLADVHFVASPLAEHRVISMGEDPKMVFNTGCPSIDLAVDVIESPQLNFDPFVKYNGLGNSFDISDGYLVVLQHPVTTEFGKAYEQTNTTLQAVKDMGKPVFWFWPNLDAGADDTSKAIRVFREKNIQLPFHFFKNMISGDFLRLIKNSLCLIGNSSVGIRESTFLGVPVVNIGSRQNGRERGDNVVDVQYESKEILTAIARQISVGEYQSNILYGDGKSGKRISDLISSIEFNIEKKDFLSKKI